jgi:hypothetical protein
LRVPKREKYNNQVQQGASEASPPVCNFYYDKDQYTEIIIVLLILLLNQQLEIISEASILRVKETQSIFA